MKRALARRPSPALVIACISLFVSLGGVSAGVATGFIDSREILDNTVRTQDIRVNAVRGVDIRNNEVRGVEIRNGTIGGRDVADGAITGADVNESRLAQVPDSAALGGVAAAGWVRRGLDRLRAAGSWPRLGHRRVRARARLRRRPAPLRAPAGGRRAGVRSQLPRPDPAGRRPPRHRRPLHRVERGRHSAPAGGPHHRSRDHPHGSAHAATASPSTASASKLTDAGRRSR